MMDFCLKVGTEIETLLRILLEDNKFNSISDISQKRSNQNINIYREVIEPVYNFSTCELYVNPIKKKIKPFESFNLETPDWFKIYSRYKHNKVKLLEVWNLKHCLYSLGCLLILVINHPSNDNKMFNINRLGLRIFNLMSSIPKFCTGIYEESGLASSRDVYLARFNKKY